MMIKIKTSELKEFFARATKIKGAHIIPVLENVKLECDGDSARLTKSALSSFIIHDINAKFKNNITLLLDEKTLTGLLKVAEGEEITIEVKDKIIYYTDGKWKANQALVEAPWPAMKSTDNLNWFQMPADMIESLGIASGYCAEHGVNKQWDDYVWIKPCPKPQEDTHCYVMGTDGIIFYSKKIEAKMPIVILEPEVCSMFSGFKMLQYAKMDNYHFYNSGNSTYGFIESEIGYNSAPFEQIIKHYNNETSFVMPKGDMVSFCDFAIAINRSALLANCYIEDAGKDQVLLRSVDNKFNNGGEHFVKVEGKDSTLIEFWFNPKQFMSFFRPLPYDKVIMYQKDNQTFFVASESDPGYIGLIRGIVFQSRPETPSKSQTAAASNTDADTQETVSEEVVEEKAPKEKKAAPAKKAPAKKSTKK
jgi:hypothetical protein